MKKIVRTLFAIVIYMISVPVDILIVTVSTPVFVVLSFFNKKVSTIPGKLYGTVYCSSKALWAWRNEDYNTMEHYVNIIDNLFE